MDRQSERVGRAVTVERLALRPAEAAKALGVGERLLWELTNRKEIPAVKLGRCTVYPVDGLRGWLNERAGVCLTKGKRAV